MDIKLENVLEQMVEQFEEKHHRLPEQIVMPPLAVLTAAVKRSLTACCQGVPIIVRNIDQSEATKNPKEAKSLGVYLRPEGTTATLVACDLKH